MEGSSRFFSHTAKIQITRREPDFITKDHIDRVLALHDRACMKVLFLDRLKEAKNEEKRNLRERIDNLSEFIEIWNTWRDFYFDAEPIQIKTKAQATVCEKIVELVEAKGYNLAIFIACTHKAFQKRKFRPGFSDNLAHGEEHYERLYEDVLVDIERKSYEESAL